MAISVPASIIEFILFGPLDDRRQLQDSPVLGDVWIRYGMTPEDAVDLLIAPYAGKSSGTVAREINARLSHESTDHQVAFLQGFVAARLRFVELITVVVPRTQWWKKNQNDRSGNLGLEDNASGIQPLRTVTHFLEMSTTQLSDVIGEVLDEVTKWRSNVRRNGSPDASLEFRTGREGTGKRLQEMPPLQRLVALAGLILWAGEANPPERTTKDATDAILEELAADAQRMRIAELMVQVRDEISKSKFDTASRNADPDVWEVSINRFAVPALTKSVKAVKADAARTLFTVDCSSITWAVIDSGIDGNHDAFLDVDGNCRVKRSFDFQNYRRIVSLSNLVGRLRAENVRMLAASEDALVDPPNFDADLEKLAQDAEEERPIHWELVRKFVEIYPGTRPHTNHGTHVAGILGANKKAAEAKGNTGSDAADGMCPDIRLYDFRVITSNLRDSEFAIIAVLQFIRHLNSQDNFLAVHGANLSLSIPHDVRNYACGRTPICVECERLIESGVVVIAAAGNHGYKTFQTNDGAFNSYAAFSITDPGNADEVLTVGSTHRFWPHTYGVSFFSSRGPTGDGRMKPDLVAPGERIRAPFPNQDWAIWMVRAWQRPM